MDDLMKHFLIPMARVKAERQLDDPDTPREDLILAGAGIANVQLIILYDFLKANGLTLDPEAQRVMDEFAALSGRLVRRVSPDIASAMGVDDAIDRLTQKLAG